MGSGFESRGAHEHPLQVCGNAELEGVFRVPRIPHPGGLAARGDLRHLCRRSPRITLGGMAGAVEERSDERGPALSTGLLRVGMWSAWAVVALSVAYSALVALSGALSGAPKDPSWAAAEAVTAVGAPIYVVLFAVIYQLSPPPARVWGLLAFGFMLAMAALTTTVHLAELFVARRIDLEGDPALGRIFGFAQPSLVFAADVAAWHFLFGLSLVFAALAFKGPGTVAYLRGGLLLGGILCLVGLIGPAVGNSYLRLIGVVGYGVVFPVLCLLMGFNFRSRIGFGISSGQGDPASR